jgi:hypothetical protein
VHRTSQQQERSHHTSLAMNIVRFMVFLVLGLLLGTLLQREKRKKVS